MAESLVSFLLNELSRVLKEEVNLQRGVKQEIELIKAELESIRAFLSVADVIEEKGPQLAVWVKQARGVAFDIEDILDSFSLYFVDRDGDQDQRPRYKCLKRIASAYKKWKINHQTGSALQRIKIRIEDISKRQKKYSSDQDFLERASTSRISNMDEVNQFRRNTLLEDESQLVGTEEPKLELTNMLLQGDSHLKIVTITGTGGLGKTTLVQQIYNNVKEKFDSKALVTVSQSLKQEELFRELIRQLVNFQLESEVAATNPQSLKLKEHLKELIRNIDAMDSHRLKVKTKELLQDKRYLIVLDDVWKPEDWDQLKVAMPMNNKGSRVIMTTRIAEVANYSATDLSMVHNMQPLSDSDSWTLFCKKTFRAESCPPHFNDIRDRIIKICGGVPLAISTLSGLLVAKGVENIDARRMILDRLSFELQQNPQLQMMKRILSLSFHDLPYYLKSCFVYLSIFPEDYLIERTRLVRMWIAEGFVEERDGMTLEEVADSYFYELLNRSLIQAVAKTYDGRVKSCRIHDFLRETILSKSEEENFVRVLVNENAVKLPEGARRLSIHHLPYQVDMLQLKSSLLPKLRSLFLFDAGTSVLELLSGGLQLLKVLDLEGAPIDTCPKQVSTLFLLRYLSLKNTNVSSLNIPLGNLHNLETLDLRQTYVTELPSEIYEHSKLRHLLIRRYVNVPLTGSTAGTVDSIKMEKLPGMKYQNSRIFSIKGFKASTKIGGLVSLQKLCFLDAEQEGGLIFELGRLVQLRRLGLINLMGQHRSFLCSSISNMQHLDSLTLHMIDKINLQGISSPPPLLKRLYLSGPLVELPSWLSSLLYLEVLHLIRSELMEDPFRSLHSMPSLTDLILFEAFFGEEMIIPPGGLARVKFLCIDVGWMHTKLLIFPTAIPRFENFLLNHYEFLGPETHRIYGRNPGFFGKSKWVSEEEWNQRFT